MPSVVLLVHLSVLGIGRSIGHSAFSAVLLGWLSKIECKLGKLLEFRFVWRLLPRLGVGIALLKRVWSGSVERLLVLIGFS